MDYKKMSLKEIRKYASIESSAISVKFARMVTPFFVKILLYTNITANQVSLFNLLFVLIPASLIAFGGYWTVLLGCFLLQIHPILDRVDGPIARIKKTVSLFGEYYESMFHDFIPPILMVALSINSYRFFNNPLYLLVGSVAVFFRMLAPQLKMKKDSLVLSYIVQNNKKLKNFREEKTKKASSLRLCKKIFRNAVIFPSCFSNLLGILLILAVFNVIQYAIIFYFVLYVSMGIAKFFKEIKKGMKDYAFE